MCNLTVTPAMDVLLKCAVLPPAMFQNKYVVCFTTAVDPALGGQKVVADVRVLTYGYVGDWPVGATPDMKSTPCVLRLSTGNLLQQAGPVGRVEYAARLATSTEIEDELGDDLPRLSVAVQGA
eukprot:SAG22_NODE_3302_length_1792_cov_4.817484_2_plen_123_part_00